MTRDHPPGHNFPFFADGVVDKYKLFKIICSLVKIH